MRITFCSLAFFLFISFAANAQEENWDAYVTGFEKGPGSVLVDLALKKSAPVSSMPYLLITGVKFKDCTPEGLPTKQGFNGLYSISDAVKASVDLVTLNKMAGTFTYQCERLDYYYVADTTGIRSRLTALYDQQFKNFTPYINIKKDASWKTYLDFLYPNEETLEYMSNTQVLLKLSEAGDKLTAPRKVDHWIYFSSVADRDCFIAYAKENNYKIESKEKIKEGKLPYHLSISRTDKVDIDSITAITTSLRKQASKCNGDYDGWETFVVK